MSKKLMRNIVFFMCAILWLSAVPNSDNFNFNLSSSKIYSSNENPTIQLETYGHSDSEAIKFRAYKIDNPIEYFESLNDPHSPDIKNLNSSNTFKILEKSFDKVKRDVHLAAREMFPSESRKLVRELINKNDQIKEKQTKQKDAKSIKAYSDVPRVLSNYEIIKEWEETLKGNYYSSYWNYYSIAVDINEPGVYLIEGKLTASNKSDNKGKVAYTTLVISDYAVITKNADNNFIAFVTNKIDGKAVKDFSLNFYMDRTLTAEKKSDNSGLISYKFPKKDKKDKDEEGSFYEYTRYLIMGYSNDQFIIAEPYIYYSSYNKYNVYLYTERPVYRPGQYVYFKCIIREKNDKGLWDNYPKKLIHIKITDARGSTVYTDSLVTSEYGSINGSIKLENEFPLGYYWIETKISGVTYSTGFEVQEYKKPEYKVTIVYDKPYYVKGEELKVNIKADYYFGSPVTDGEVEYLVYRSRYYRYSDEDILDESEDYYSYYGRELLESNRGTLNSEGSFSFSYYTDSQVKNDYQYIVVANVQDKSNRTITATRQIKVMRGNFDISVSLDKYIYSKGDEIKFLVTAGDYQNNPVMTNYKLSIYSDKYERVEKQNVITYESRKELITTLSGSTNSDGENSISYKIKEQSGYFVAEVTAKDKAGNEISSSHYFYVSSITADFGYYNSSDNIKIIPEQKKYSNSDAISALIIIPYKGSDVLITAERNDIYYSKVEHFDGTSKVITIPANEAFSPNVFITVSLITNNEFFNQVKEIVIPNNEKLLNIDVESNQGVFKPGERGKLTLLVKDYKNKPVKNAEISIGVVDESIYDIVADQTTDIKKQFYSKSYNSVNTSSSLYFSFYGYSREIRDDEYSELYIKKSANKAEAQSDRERIAYGDVKGEKFAEPKIRKDFKDVIYWNPSIITDKNGKAEIDLQFPDNLTTWRSTIRAITKETAVSSTINRVITRKDLIIRAEVPRFFITKDEAIIAVTVHNYTNADKNVNVSLKGENIDIFGETKNVKIPKNGQVSLDFPVATIGYTGTAKFIAKATTDTESDAVELSVPILEHGIEMTVRENIILKEKSSESGSATFSIGEHVNIGTSKIVISTSASPVSTILNSLDELIDYPYGCVEQTMSRFLPALVVQNSAKELGLTVTDKMKNELPVVISQGLKRLYSFQHSDGGWGWWKDDDTDPTMTAYVIYGLTTSEQNGNSINKDILSSGMENLKWQIENKNNIDLTTKAYMIYSLSLSNSLEKKFNNELLLSYINKLNKQAMNVYGKALIALAYSTLGKKDDATILYKELSAGITLGDNVSSWLKVSQQYYGWQNDIAETIAFVLKAMIKINPNDKKIEEVVNFLLSTQGSLWSSTKQTATVIYALTDYLKASSVMKTDYTAKIYNNGKLISQIKINKENLFKRHDNIIITSKDLTYGDNIIKIEKEGEGKLFATNTLVYFTNEDNIQASGSDFTVSRSYYRLQLKRFGDVLKYAKEPIQENINSGDLILVKINVRSNIDNNYFMLEDPIASGYEPLLGNQEFAIADENNNYYYNWLYTSQEFRDQKVTFFSSRIPKGNYEFSYVIQAQIPGTYHIMPAQAFLMYYPEVRGNSDEKIVRIN